MDPRRFARLKEIFAQARDLPIGERRDYLARASDGDEELRREVAALLAEDAQSGEDAVGRALGDAEDLTSASELPTPRRIGRYRILGICGSGGMGTVYEAEQDSPLRRVALKLIQAGAMRPELLSRFRREARILAHLEHPGIAQIFEAGEFEHEGVSRPFFAMEFVSGQSPLTYANKHRLDASARIDMFLRICEAIHYAHEQGVVHRDLKPDNILVVETSGATSTSSNHSGQPKILDFGVASLTDSDYEATMATGGQLLGSVPYMSPEQASGHSVDIGPRSDLYSLGVLLFELLTGTLPYSVRQRSLADALRAIQDDEPTRLGSVRRALRGDLDTIVGKCLEKLPERRYASVASLAEDLHRYRNLQPIAARPPSTWYQLRKFSERNKALVVGAMTTLLALVGGVIVAVIIALQSAEHAKVALESQAQSARNAYRANLAAASALFDRNPVEARKLLADVPADLRGWEWRYLSSALSGFLLEFGEIKRLPQLPQLSFSFEDMYLMADGREVIGLQADATFTIWETRTGKLSRRIQAPGPVGRFAVSCTGSLLAAALLDGTIVVSDPRTEPSIWTPWFEPTNGVDTSADELRILTLAVDPSGQRIAFQSSDELHYGRPGSWEVSDCTCSYWFPPGLAFSDDGARLAVLPGAAVWDVQTRQLIQEPFESTQVHWSIAFDPDRRHLAVGQLRREVRIYDSASGELKKELFGHTGVVSQVAYGSQDRVLSVSRADGTIRVWDLASGTAIAIFDAPDTSKALFVDDDHVLSLTGGRFRLWTLKDRGARQLVGHRGRVFDAAFSGGGDLLVTSAPWSDMILWDSIDGRALLRFPASKGGQFAFDAAGENLLHGYNSSAVTRIPLFGGEREPVIAKRGMDHRWRNPGTLQVDGSDAAFDVHGLNVFRTVHGAGEAWCNGDALQLKPATAARRLGPHPALFVGDLGGAGFIGTVSELMIFDGALSQRAGIQIDAYLETRRRGEAANLPVLEDGAPLLAHFRADRHTVHHEDRSVLGWTASNDPSIELALQGMSRAIRFVEASAGKPAQVSFARAFEFGSQSWLECPVPQLAGRDSVTVCWLGRYEVKQHQGWQTAYRIGAFHMPFQAAGRDPRVGKLGRELCFSADGRFRVDAKSSDIVGSVTVRDTTTGYAVARFDGDYHALDFRLDLVQIAAGTKQGKVDIFDVSTGACVTTIEAHEGLCYDVAFSPDGTRLATSGNDNALRIWDTETWEKVFDVPGHRSYVTGLAWSPDGTMLVSACGDFGVRIWDAMPRNERYRQLLASQALQDEVRGQIEAIRRREKGPLDAAVIRGLWPADPARFNAAIKVMAREK